MTEVIIELSFSHPVGDDGFFARTNYLTLVLTSRMVMDDVNSEPVP